MLSNTNLSKEAATLTRWLVSIPSVAHAKGPALICKAIYDGLSEFPYFKKNSENLTLISHGESGKSSVVALVRAMDTVDDTIVLLCDTDTSSPYHYGALKGFSTNCDELRNRLSTMDDITDPVIRAGIENDELLFGLGVLQSKCATGSMLVALKELSDNQVRLNVNVLFICTSESAISHRGIKKCIPYLEELTERERLHLKLAINARPNFPLHRNDRDLHIYTGNYGKVEPSFYIIGNSTSAFRPFSGFSASIIASELIRQLELNPDIIRALNNTPLVPTFDSLRVKEFGKDYSPDGMQVSFSLPIVNVDLGDLLALLKKAAAAAIEHAAELVDQRESAYAELNGEVFVPMSQDAEVVSFSDLLERASHNFNGNLQKALQGMVQKCRSEGLSLHQASITIIERLNELAKLPRPSVVVYFTDNFLPPQGLSASLSQDRELFMMLDGLISRFASVSKITPTLAMHYAPGEACLLRPVNLNSSLTTLARECPVGIENLHGLNVPAITLGIKGDHLSLLTEHVDKRMFEYLPSLIVNIVEAVTASPEASLGYVTPASAEGAFAALAGPAAAAVSEGTSVNNMDPDGPDRLTLTLEQLSERAEALSSETVSQVQEIRQEHNEDGSFYTQIARGTLEPQSLSAFLKPDGSPLPGAELRLAQRLSGPARPRPEGQEGNNIDSGYGYTTAEAANAAQAEAAAAARSSRTAAEAAARASEGALSARPISVSTAGQGDDSQSAIDALTIQNLEDSESSRKDQEAAQAKEQRELARSSDIQDAIARSINEKSADGSTSSSSAGAMSDDERSRQELADLLKPTQVEVMAADERDPLSGIKKLFNRDQSRQSDGEPASPGLAPVSQAPEGEIMPWEAQASQTAPSGLSGQQGQSGHPGLQDQSVQPGLPDASSTGATGTLISLDDNAAPVDLSSQSSELDITPAGSTADKDSQDDQGTVMSSDGAEPLPELSQPAAAAPVEEGKGALKLVSSFFKSLRLGRGSDNQSGDAITGAAAQGTGLTSGTAATTAEAERIAAIADNALNLSDEAATKVGKADQTGSQSDLNDSMQAATASMSDAFQAAAQAPETDPAADAAAASQAPADAQSAEAQTADAQPADVATVITDSEPAPAESTAQSDDQQADNDAQPAMDIGVADEIQPQADEAQPEDDAADAAAPAADADAAAADASDAEAEDKADTAAQAADSAADSDVMGNEVSSEQVASMLASSINEKINSNTLASIDEPSSYQHNDLPLNNGVYATDIDRDQMGSLLTPEGEAAIISSGQSAQSGEPPAQDNDHAADNDASDATSLHLRDESGSQLSSEPALSADYQPQADAIEAKDAPETSDSRDTGDSSDSMAAEHKAHDRPGAAAAYDAAFLEAATGIPAAPYSPAQSDTQTAQENEAQAPESASAPDADAAAAAADEVDAPATSAAAADEAAAGAAEQSSLALSVLGNPESGTAASEGAAALSRSSPAHDQLQVRPSPAAEQLRPARHDDVAPALADGMTNPLAEQTPEFAANPLAGEESSATAAVPAQDGAMADNAAAAPATTVAQAADSAAAAGTAPQAKTEPEAEPEAAASAAAADSAAVAAEHSADASNAMTRAASVSGKAGEKRADKDARADKSADAARTEADSKGKDTSKSQKAGQSEKARRKLEEITMRLAARASGMEASALKERMDAQRPEISERPEGGAAGAAAAAKTAAAAAAAASAAGAAGAAGAAAASAAGGSAFSLPSDSDVTRAIDTSVNMMARNRFVVSEDPHNTRDPEEVFAEAEAEAAALRAEVEERRKRITEAIAREDEQRSQSSDAATASASEDAGAIASARDGAGAAVEAAAADSTASNAADSQAAAQDRPDIAALNQLIENARELAAEESAAAAAATAAAEEKANRAMAEAEAAREARRLAREAAEADAAAAAQAAAAAAEPVAAVAQPGAEPVEAETETVADAEAVVVDAAQIHNEHRFWEKSAADAKVQEQVSPAPEFGSDTGTGQNVLVFDKLQTKAALRNSVDVEPLDDATRRELDGLRRVGTEEAIAQLLYADEDFSDDADERINQSRQHGDDNALETLTIEATDVTPDQDQEPLSEEDAERQARRAALRRAMYGDDSADSGSRRKGTYIDLDNFGVAKNIDPDAVEQGYTTTSTAMKEPEPVLATSIGTVAAPAQNPSTTRVVGRSTSLPMAEPKSDTFKNSTYTQEPMETVASSNPGVRILRTPNANLRRAQRVQSQDKAGSSDQEFSLSDDGNALISKRKGAQPEAATAASRPEPASPTAIEGSVADLARSAENSLRVQRKKVQEDASVAPTMVVGAPRKENKAEAPARPEPASPTAIEGSTEVLARSAENSLRNQLKKVQEDDSVAPTMVVGAQRKEKKDDAPQPASPTAIEGSVAALERSAENSLRVQRKKAQEDASVAPTMVVGAPRKDNKAAAPARPEPASPTAIEGSTEELARSAENSLRNQLKKVQEDDSVAPTMVVAAPKKDKKSAPARDRSDEGKPVAPTAIAGSTEDLARSAENSLRNQLKKVQEDTSVPQTIVVRSPK